MGPPNGKLGIGLDTDYLLSTLGAATAIGLSAIGSRQRSTQLQSDPKRCAC